MKSPFQRMLRSGFTDFKRNAWLSVATISVMFLVLFLIEGLLMFSVVTKVLVDTLKDKIDISVYFTKGTTEAQILDVQSRLQAMPEVKTAEYISENEALSRFKTRYSDNPALLESIDQLDQNPLKASLNIKAIDPQQYQKITSFLEQDSLREITDKITYYQNRSVIDRLGRIVSGIETGGLIASLVLAAIAVLIAFNTIRLAIYTSREEISIMKLVGATPGFVRGPYLLEGAMYGLIAAVVSIVIFYPMTLIAAPKLESLLPGINLAQYYIANIFQISGTLIVIGVVLGIISSTIAIRRYLQV